MASAVKEAGPGSGKSEGQEGGYDISVEMVGVESELELMTLSDEISASLLHASLSEYQ